MEAGKKERRSEKESQEEMNLNSDQAHALNILKHNTSNLFLTGVAGSGKSTVINEYLKIKPSIPRLASTGAAALLISGRTFHSFFGLGLMQGPKHLIINKACSNKYTVRRLEETKEIVIDEISMLPSLALYYASLICQDIRGSEKPWGGIRAVAVGDYAQLPPISEYNGKRDWAFLSDIWKESNFESVLLKKVMRTNDLDFLEILNLVRLGRVTDKVKNFLNSHRIDRQDPALNHMTNIFPTKEKSNTHNDKLLGALRDKEVVIRTIYSGDDRYFDSLRKNLPMGDSLKLKIGALVMIRKNDYLDHQYVNGSIGTILGITPNVITIRLKNGALVDLTRSDFLWYNPDGREVASANNFPLTLAYASTIHKMQGATIEGDLAIDLSDLWEPGHAYVALSRSRNSNNVHIIDWNSQGVLADRKVAEFYEKLGN